MTTLPALGYLSGALLHALVDYPTFSDRVLRCGPC